MKKSQAVLLSSLSLLSTACPNGVEPGTDAGVPAEETCPGPLPAAPQTCTDPMCSATSGTKLFGEATLASDKGKGWVITTWASSEVAGPNDNTTVDYTRTVMGGLAPAAAPRGEEAALERARRHLGEALYQEAFSPARLARVRGDVERRSWLYQGPVDWSRARGTAIRGKTADLLPPGVSRQATACSSAAPSCGASMLCVIPENTSDGTCESAMTIKFRTGATTKDDVTAQVKKVGTFGAIVVDDAIAQTVPQADIDTLMSRFDQHIAPLDHQLFGQAKDAQGKDRDGNGVVILFLTNRVAQRQAGVVGYFLPDDMLPSATEPTSNAADILYLQAPGGAITLDALSGTLGHEYQHLINYTQKKIIRQSGPEEVWLDEGIATFAEDVLGYGSDAFENVAAYLGMFDSTSLTGVGTLGGDADSVQRRGMAHLLVRYLFEQKGGATFGAQGSATDKGGVAAVKKLVESADTGTFLFTQATTGKDFHAWLGDLVTTVTIDGAKYPNVSCNPEFSFRAPEMVELTGGQRGIDMRGSFKSSTGRTVTLTGPNTAALMDGDTGIPIPGNGGEVRTVDTPSGTVKVSVGGSVDFNVGFRVLPTK